MQMELPPFGATGGQALRGRSTTVLKPSVGTGKNPTDSWGWLHSKTQSDVTPTSVSLAQRPLNLPSCEAGVWHVYRGKSHYWIVRSLVNGVKSS